MGKSKKITEKVKLFYRGPALKPSKTASNDDMTTIVDSFKECLPLRNKIFITNWRDKPTKLRLIVGLSASLRALKQRITKAIIYDETADCHLAKYLIEFARHQKFPIIQARGLTQKASEFNLTTLLVVSIIAAAPDATQSVELNDKFDKLFKFLIDPEPTITAEPGEVLEFKLPVLEKVPPSGKSREKKQARRAKIAAENSQQTHVGKKIKPVKMSK